MFKELAVIQVLEAYSAFVGTLRICNDKHNFDPPRWMLSYELWQGSVAGAAVSHSNTYNMFYCVYRVVEFVGVLHIYEFPPWKNNG
jgi:hypothetical protein